ncbi:MAG: exodeoxyribonuclease VII large subunit [Saprospiraceae bacterium]
MNSYSLLELNDYIKRVISLNFAEPIWVHCELSSVKESRGSVYVDLVQQDEKTNTVVSQSSAVIWYKSYLFIRTKLGLLLPSILKEGTKVLVKVNVEYHEKWGMKLVIVDIDPSFTIGQMEMARQKVIEKLKSLDVLEKNSFTYLPSVIQKVAVISSATAAGYKDFIHQIEDNDYGYNIDIDLYPSAMQGSNTEKEVCAALDDIMAKLDQYDCVTIIRGGGAKLDLAYFDNYNIAYKISTFPIPILTGIGHEIDSTVADLVSFHPLKTPTAVASYIIDRNLTFESEILQAGNWINQLAKQKIEHHKLTLQQLTTIINHKPFEIIRSTYLHLEQVKNLVHQAAKYSVKELAEHINYIEKMIRMADPKLVLKRGYTILRQKDNVVIGSISQLKKGDIIDIEMHDGCTQAKIENTDKRNNNGKKK